MRAGVVMLPPVTVTVPPWVAMTPWPPSAVAVIVTSLRVKR